MHVIVIKVELIINMRFNNTFRAIHPTSRHLLAASFQKRKGQPFI